jgi:hypothetical protein
MIALAHMTESLTYYKRLLVMEAEGEVYEILRKLETAVSGKEALHEELMKTEKELIAFKKALADRLEKMDDIPALEKIGD